MQSTGVKPALPARGRILLGAPLLPLAIAFALGCNGDGNDGEDTPSPSPTATQSPAATASATPVDTTDAPSDTPGPTPEPTPTPVPQVDVTPVDPFGVRSAEAINVRETPSTDSDLIGAIYPGEIATVTGEAHGEAVEAGNDTWYQVEFTRDGEAIRGFLYAAYVAPAS